MLLWIIILVVLFFKFCDICDHVYPCQFLVQMYNQFNLWLIAKNRIMKFFWLEFGGNFNNRDTFMPLVVGGGGGWGWGWAILKGAIFFGRATS
jgi:hypothetical protein